MLILEGPDGAGKSTLARQLAERFGYRLQAFGVPEQPPIEEYLHFLVDQPDNRLVCDRFHLGENVYGPIWRKTRLTVQAQLAIEYALRVRGAALVLVTGEAERLREAIRTRGDELVNEELIDQLVQSFAEEVRPVCLLHLRYDFTQKESQDLLEGFLRSGYPHVVELAGAYRGAFPSMPGIGSLDPSIILVGERPNPRALHRSRGVPFAVGPAGEWLFGALNELRWYDQVYLTNAFRGNGSSDSVAQEIRWFQGRSPRVGPTVIALGKEASRVLKKRGIRHTLRLHPQYAKRFQHHTRDYALHLSEVFD